MSKQPKQVLKLPRKRQKIKLPKRNNGGFPMHLNLTVTFATSRYHGRSSESELEFPPSPSRLFQALIAGSHCGAYDLIHRNKRDCVLQWLESLEPPVIETPVICKTGIGITNYVPNNDDKTPSTGHV